MLEYITEIDPMLAAAVFASLFALLLYYLYGGFIEENYRKINWLRRLFLPHVSYLLRKIDKQNEEIDMSEYYVRTSSTSRTHAFDLYLHEGVPKDVHIDSVGDELIENHFRPEVLLASLSSNSNGEYEVANFVLTAPQKDRTDAPALGRMRDIVLMFTAKYQLHVRLFYDENKHRLRFHAHHELNPYNPLYVLKHYRAEDFDSKLDVKLFEEYKDDIAEHGVEVIG